MSEVPESPQTRIETYLAGALGQAVVLPEPVTRLEQYLKAIAESGGGGGGLMPVIIYAESHTTVETYEVPVLTDTQITAAYNGVMAGKVVVVVDDMDFIAMQVYDASNIDGTAIRLIFTDKMILNYKEGGEIEATLFAGGTAPVASVNGKTGAVVLSAADILAQNSQSIQNNLERIDDDVADANDAIDELGTRVDNLQNIGRFLAIWNATTGEPTSEPPESPYSYRTGDYYRIGTVGDRIPTGATYTIGGINYTTTTDTLEIGDIFYYDGTVWRRQATTGGGTVQDVQVNGTSVLAGGVANIEDFDGASSSSAGSAGLVPAPTAADGGKFLKGDGTWGEAGGGGAFVTLTSADYNWPTSNPTEIALWLLDSGLYTISSGVSGKVRHNRNSYVPYGVSFVAIVDNNATTGYKQYFMYKDSGVYTAGVDSSGYSTIYSEYEYVNKTMVNNDLTTTAAGYVLDARQGKVLKDLYDALEERVRALEGNA